MKLYITIKPFNRFHLFIYIENWGANLNLENPDFSDTIHFYLHIFWIVLSIMNDIGSRRTGPIIMMYLLSTVFRPLHQRPPERLQSLQWGWSNPTMNGRLLCSSLLHQIHKDVFPACTQVSFMILFPSLPVMPSLPSVLHTGCAGKPRHPNYTGKHHVFYSLSWHCSTNSWYFNRLRSWASSTLSYTVLWAL